MITVHHLRDSRSHRILWLLEELGLPYEVDAYDRDANGRAPAALRALNPLGRAPVITDGDRRLKESGAVVDYLIRRHGGGRLQPDPSTPAYDDYVHWLHYAEGSAMLPFEFYLRFERLGAAAAPMMAEVEREIDNHLRYIDGALRGRIYLLGDELTGADIVLMDIGKLARQAGKIDAFPAIAAWYDRLQNRPAFIAALKRGGVNPA